MEIANELRHRGIQDIFGDINAQKVNNEEKNEISLLVSVLYSIVQENCEFLNRLLAQQGVKGIKTKVISNIDFEEANSQRRSRYYIQVYIINTNRDLNLLSDPYLFIEVNSNSKSIIIFWSSITSRTNEQILMINEKDEEKIRKTFSPPFLDVLVDFIKKNISSIISSNVRIKETV